MRRVQYEVNRAAEFARHYDSLGWRVLPSRPDAKRPALSSYKRWLHEPIPREWLANWRWRDIQVVTGSASGVIVVDLDGREALDRVWPSMLPPGESISPWVSGAVEGWPWLPEYSCSQHLWFAIPAGVKVPTTILWKGHGHSEVKVLGERALVRVPPSRHPERGTPYEWMIGPGGSEGYPDLMAAPSWLMEAIRAARPEKVAPEPVLEPLRPLGEGPRLTVRSSEVLALLGSRKLDIAVFHGLDVVPGGTYPYKRCRAAGREDRNPSGTFDVETGRFYDWGLDESCSFFELLARLDPGTFPDWREACRAMATLCGR